MNAGAAASIGGSSGVNAGGGASLGGSNGVNAGLGASVGGSGGVNAGIAANVGGGDGLGANVGIGVGGTGPAARGSNGGGSGVAGLPGGGAGGLGGNGTIGGGSVVRPGRAPGLGVRNPATTGSVTPSSPGAQGRLAAELGSMSTSQKRELRRSCAAIDANPEGFDASMRGLCNLLSRMSGL